MKKWEEVLYKYKEYSDQQISKFKEIGEASPYLSFDDIDIKCLTTGEKEDLEKIDINSNSSDILYLINKILDRFKPVKDRRVRIEEAEAIICKIEKYIPEKEAIDFNGFCSWCSMYLKVTPEELQWLHKNGYIPHLYLTKGKPKFYDTMWFTVDAAIRRMREKTGLGIFSGFRDPKNKPEPWRLKQQIDLIHYMYYSWKIVEKILNLSDKKTRADGWKGHDFQIVRQNYTRDFYKNEGKVLAEKLLKLHGFDDKRRDLLEFYRDEFALYSYEAFPLRHLITVGGTRKWRTWYLTEADQIGLLSIWHPVHIDTYAQKGLSEAYQLLSFQVDCALALSEGREILDTEDIVSWFVKKSTEEGKRQCFVCGTPFKPKRSIDVTCGKESCIRENKNKSKRKSLSSKFRPFDS